jgi:signal transduction histidine kinase
MVWRAAGPKSESDPDGGLVRIEEVTVARQLSLAGQFLLASFLISVVGAALVGAWVGQQIEAGVVTRAGAIAALYVDSVVARPLQPLASQGALGPSDVAALDRLVAETGLGERVVSFKVWSPDGQVLYSTDRSLIGRRFPIDASLARSLAGGVSASLSDLDEVENERERGRFDSLLEVYAPVRDDRSGRVIAVAEFYQPPDDLVRDVAAAQRRSWGVVGGTALVTYLLLAGIVRRGSDTIERQQSALRAQVRELRHLLTQNGHLRERALEAASRTTALNEQALRRIGSDLHDGPGQALALALLRLDDLAQAGRRDGDEVERDFAVVHRAVRDALTDLRAIASGLRIPELAPLTLAEVAERAVRDHQRRSGTPVRLDLGSVPSDAPLAIKIALLRTLQEALSNATRHGRGEDVAARLSSDGDRLKLRVADGGPGFDPGVETDRGGLGLAGMRERAQMLGGTFDLDSAPGRGAVVDVSWPLAGSRAA